MRSWAILQLLWMIIAWGIPWLHLSQAVDLSNRDIYDENETRSRLLLINGNMVFHAGHDRNITFLTSGGGSVYLDNVDISGLPNTTEWRSFSASLAVLQRDVHFLSQKNALQTKRTRVIADTVQKLLATSRNLTASIKRMETWRETQIARDSKMRKLILRLMKNLKTLTGVLATDPCKSSPCSNGGTCIPVMGKKVICLCPPTKTGDTCEEDVNACAIYQGTSMGCQNNGTCYNQDGIVGCHCPSGYHGPLCQFKTSTCLRNAELCGEHGHCIDLPTQGSESQYKCLCEWGYRVSSDTTNPTCVDINECESNPCHPDVICINLPGTFKCSGCPPGYQGNGLTCSDVDECSSNPYPCSTSPRVECINTVGSFKCESCPPGFTGNGHKCDRLDVCASNPCHPEATCSEDTSEESLSTIGYVCQCPSGYAGSGVGPNGCYQTNTTICHETDKCLNGGTCQAVTDVTYRCVCPSGYLGSRCETPSACLSAPCKNEGKCFPRNGGRTFYCQCATGFYGFTCEREEDSCGMHIRNTTGTFSFPEGVGLRAPTEKCDIVIAPENMADNKQQLEIWFEKFQGMGMGTEAGKTDCEKTVGNLTIFDGISDRDILIATFCGEGLSGVKAPPASHPIKATSSQGITLRYQGDELGSFRIRWELVEKKCGFRTKLEEGVQGSIDISLTSAGATIACDYFLHAPPNRVIELTLPPLTLASGDKVNCDENSLEFYDSFAVNLLGHRILRLCETSNETQTIRTTGPYLSIMFRSFNLTADIDVKDDRKRVALQYRVAKPKVECGGLIRNDGDLPFEGEITSPNFGSLYYPNTDCTWEIEGAGDLFNDTIADDHNLKFEFLEFDVPSSPKYRRSGLFNLDSDAGYRGFSLPQWRLADVRRIINNRRLTLCGEDYVKIIAGSSILVDYCSENPPRKAIYTYEPNAIVKFHSDEAKNGRGFRLKYSMVCEKVFNELNGTIHSANYPNRALRPFKCTYKIVAPPKHAIKIKVKYVGLRDATTAQCFFSKNLDSENYVEFSGGSENNKQLNARYYCAKFPFVQEGVIITSGNQPVVITYSTNGSRLNTGFLLEYEMMDVGCGGLWFGATGTISSPNYPEKYLPHMHCEDSIVVSYNRQVRLTFDNFEMEAVSNDHCSYDSVVVKDSDRTTILGKFCGTLLPPSLLSSGNKMFVEFKSDRSVSGTGFSARYTAVDILKDCDRTFTGTSGIIVYNGTEAKNPECEYHIAVTPGFRVVLTMNEIKINCYNAALMIRNGLNEHSPGFHGLYGDSTVCDKHPFNELRSHGNRVYMKVKTQNPSLTFFNVSYEMISAGCGGHIDGYAGAIAAPQYPHKDIRGLDCVWNIAVAQGNRVRLMLSMVDDLRSGDSNGFCGLFASNHIDILDGSHGDARILRRVCTQLVSPEPITSEKNLLTVKYHQQGGIQLGAIYGFLAHFTTVCKDIVLTDFTGSIQSPGYGSETFGNKFCTWTIKAPPGNRIQITVHKFLVQSKSRMSTCREAYLKIDPDDFASADVSTSNGVNVTNQMSTFCTELGEPLQIKTSGNEAHLTYASQLETNNFWISWRTLGCGGELHDGQEVVVTKGDLAENAKYAECNWVADAPPGYVVKLNILKLAIYRDQSEPCEAEKEAFEGIGLYSGKSNVSGIPQYVRCDQAENITYTSHSSELFIKMKLQLKHAMADSTAPFFKFRVVFEEANATNECTARINVATDVPSFVHSPDYPLIYPTGVECTYVFVAPIGYSLRMELQEYFSPNFHPQQKSRGWNPPMTSNVTCQEPIPQLEGSISIYSANTTDSTLLERICVDIEDPVKVDVSSQESLVVFHGATIVRQRLSGEDHSKKKIGFKLKVEAVCGGTLLASDTLHTIHVADLKADYCNFTIRKPENERTPGIGVYLRIDEAYLRRKLTPSEPDDTFELSKLLVSVDGGEWRSDTYMAPYNQNAAKEYRADDNVRISVKRARGFLREKVAFSYSTDIQTCGGSLTSTSGFITMPKISGNFECEWTISNFAGSQVWLNMYKLKLPASEYCSESYLEVRKQNMSGSLIGRYCDNHRDVYVKSDEPLWVKLRFNVEDSDMERQEEEEDEVVDSMLTGRRTDQEIGMDLSYERQIGGITNSSVVEYNSKVGEGSIYAWKVLGEEDKGIVVHFEQLAIPDDTANSYGVFITEAPDTGVNMFAQLDSTQRFTGWTPPADIYLPYSSFLIRYHGPAQSGFRLRWESVPKRNGNQTQIAEEKKEKEYACGGVIVPTMQPQVLTNPGYGSYASNQHCKWTFERPMFHGLAFKIVDMDLETVDGCRYDYIAFVAQRGRGTEDTGDDLTDANRLCLKVEMNRTIEFTYNKIVYLHFVTDHNRNQRGFKIEYRLTCTSFDYVKSSYGLLNSTLASYNWPRKYEDNKICYSTLVLESNRRIQVKILDFEMEAADGEGICTNDWLYISHKASFGPVNKSNYYCGTIADIEETRRTVILPVGRLFLRMSANNKINGRGYLLQITELMEECNGETLTVDEQTGPQYISSPLYPKMSPNSLDCRYVISAPNGHRLKFTVDPHNFDLQNSDNETCVDDYLEIRDGPTEHSRLIGKYCNKYAPSTVFSTGNFLFVRYITDSYAQSMGWNATYELASCGGTVVLREGSSYKLTSPNFPEVYPQKIDCQWLVKAPNTHFVNARLDHLWVTYGSNCSADYLAIRDGNATADYLMKPRCAGLYSVSEGLQYRSSSSLMTVDFHSNHTTSRGSRVFCNNRKCGFAMNVSVSEIACGGRITNDEGVLTTPGFPGKLLPHIRCDWTFEAGIGNRYEVEFEFTDESGYNHDRFGQAAQGKCFMDVQVFNGRPEHSAASFMSKRFFCEGSNKFTSSADLMSMWYSDQPTRESMRYSEITGTPDMFYRPFKITYRKIAQSESPEQACMYLIDRNTTLFIGGLNQTDTDMRSAYCHIVIRRPTETGTTSIKFENFQSTTMVTYSFCNDYGSYVQIKSITDTPLEVDEKICNATVRAMGVNATVEKIYLNQELELHVFTQIAAYGMSGAGMQFNLVVEFQECGGLIKSPNTGVVTSPNFGEGRSYLPDSNCLWMLEAPPGEVVKLTFTDMDIEADISCSRDLLLLTEGKDQNPVHRYCNEERTNVSSNAHEELPERFAQMQSRSRWMSLQWTTDFSKEGRGWRADYEFVNAASECGFISFDKSGVVHSPNFPQDYGNDEECIWDIQVPLGYSIRVAFDTFDVQMSENCEKDALIISQEHQSQAWAPVGGYYFLFNQEEKHSPYCGINLPEVFYSESNRIRLNFTTDTKTTGKGFRASWSSVCKTVFRLNHGVVTSPNYPEHYPNVDTECDYLIDPEDEQSTKVIVIKMLDFDLSPSIHELKRVPCGGDYVEIRDVLNKRVVISYCADEATLAQKEFPPISIKGPVGVRFISNNSFLSYGDKKIFRGFKLSYALHACGGDIELKDEQYRLSTTLQSPAFPLPYPEELDCTWNITAPEGRVLVIKMEKLDIEVSDQCHLDYLEIIDIKQNKSTSGPLCGDRIVKTTYSTTSNNLHVRFVTDRTVHKGGFNMVITASPGPDMGCGGKLAATGDWAVMKSPVRDDGKYYSDMRCGWTIKGTTNTMLELKITKMDTELPTTMGSEATEGQQKCIDALTIYDGYPNFSPILASDLCSATLTEESLPKVYHTSHDVAYLYFTSDYGEAGTGFTIEYRAVVPDCGGRYQAGLDLQSLNYDSTPELGARAVVQRCQFVITSQEQAPIILTFGQLSFPSSDADCSDVYMEVRDAGKLAACQHPACAKEEHEKKVIRFCGKNTTPAPFISNTMAIQITTVADRNNGGDFPFFNLEYQVLGSCNRTVDARRYKSGRLTSPNFPKPYSHNSTCLTALQTDNDKRILIVFRRFAMERGRLRSTVMNNSPGQSGRVRSRDWRRWMLRRRPFEFGCDFDYLEIREANANATGPYCSSAIPPTFWSNEPIVEVFIKTDDSHAMEGYDATYYSGAEDSDGKIAFAENNDLIGAVTNIGYPAGYNESTEQTWTIAPPSAHKCAMQLEKLDLSLAVNNTACSTEEYLEITYIADDRQVETGRISSCLNATLDVPRILDLEPEAGRRIQIRFKTDDRTDNDGVGFRITWECTNYEEQN